MGAPARRIVDMPVDRLIPYEGNARRHSDAQVAKIARSIEAFGFNAPILVDARNVIVAGHGRLLAARRLGLDKVPVLQLGDLTEEQRRAYTIADNRLAEEATWDLDMLAAELDAIRSDGVFALDVTGFDGEEIDRLLQRLERGGALDGEDDAPPAPEPDEVVSCPGDLWILGEHRVICGDCTSRDVVARLLAGAAPHLMVTDPPYGVSYDPSWRADAERAAGKKLTARAVGKVTNDDRADWQAAWALFAGDVAYVWHGALHHETVVASLRKAGFEVRAQIIWVKSRPVISRGHYHWQHEPALYVERAADAPAWEFDHELGLYTVRIGATGHWRGDRRQSTVWTIDHIRSETGHGTQKPVEAMRRPMLNNSAPGDSVYDPFLGSGTTVIAAEGVGRRAYGCEIDPRYVDVIVRRWQDFTGRSAFLEGAGVDFATVGAERLGAAAA